MLLVLLIDTWHLFIFTFSTATSKENIKNMISNKWKRKRKLIHLIGCGSGSGSCFFFLDVEAEAVDKKKSLLEAEAEAIEKKISIFKWKRKRLKNFFTKMEAEAEAMKIFFTKLKRKRHQDLPLPKHCLVHTNDSSHRERGIRFCSCTLFPSSDTAIAASAISIIESPPPIDLIQQRWFV